MMRSFSKMLVLLVTFVVLAAAQRALAIQFQSNLLMHFDAANVQTSGSNVTRWYNQGTAGSVLDAVPDVNSPLSVGSVAAINNQPVVRFDTSSVKTLRTGALGSDIAQPITIFHVGMMTNTAGSPFYYDGRVNGKRAAFYHFTGTTSGIYAGVNTASGGTTAVNNYYA